MHCEQIWIQRNIGAFQVNSRDSKKPREYYNYYRNRSIECLERNVNWELKKYVEFGFRNNSNGFQIDDIKYLFDYVDEDKDGLITFDELRKILVEAEIQMDFDLFADLLEEINPEKKEKYDVDMVIHFFQISPEEDAQVVCQKTESKQNQSSSK